MSSGLNNGLSAADHERIEDLLNLYEEPFWEDGRGSEPYSALFYVYVRGDLSIMACWTPQRPYSPPGEITIFSGELTFPKLIEPDPRSHPEEWELLRIALGLDVEPHVQGHPLPIPQGRELIDRCAYPQLIEAAIFKGHRGLGDDGLRLELAELAVGLADLGPTARVYDPFAGFGALGTKVPGDVEYHARATTDLDWAITTIRMRTRDPQVRFQLHQEHPSTPWPAAVATYDLVFVHPPYGSTVDKPVRLGTVAREFDRSIDTIEDFLKSKGVRGDGFPEYYPYRNISSESYDLLYAEFGAHKAEREVSKKVEDALTEHESPLKATIPWEEDTPVDILRARRAIDMAKPGGKVMLVVPTGFLNDTSRQYQDFREELLREGWLDTVVQFPGGLLRNSGIPLALVVIDKGRAPGTPVRMVDAEAFIKQGTRHGVVNIDVAALTALIRRRRDGDGLRNVSLEMIREHNHIWPPALFVWAPEHVVPDGTDLGSILFQATDPWRVGGHNRIRSVDLKDAFGWITGKEEGLLDGAIGTSGRLLVRSALLVDLSGHSFKPTFFEHSGVDVTLSKTIHGFGVSDPTKVDPEYVAVQLLSDHVAKQAKGLRKGSMLTKMEIEDFRSIRIPLPGLDEQAAIVLREKRRILEERAKELDDYQAKLGVEKDQRIINSSLRHSIAGPLGDIRHNFEQLKNGLIRGPFDLNYPVGKDKNGKDKTIRSVLEGLDRKVKEVSSEVKRSGREGSDVRSTPLTEVNLVDFMRVFGSDHGSDIHELEIFDSFLDDQERERVLIRADESLLRQLLDNLIENADRHAFNKSSREKNRVRIHLSRDPDSTTSIRLRVENTGSPFPEGFTQEKFIKRGLRAGAHQGDGVGGALINDIIEHLGGSFELDTVPRGAWTTVFTFLFPLSTRP